MKIAAAEGHPGIATVYLAEMDNGKYIEFVESVQPPVPKSEKWVLIVSTLYGCPVGCTFCDAGGWYEGKLSVAEIMVQLDYLVDKSFAGRSIPVNKFKVQFARMGEPAYNMNVLEVLEEMPVRYKAPGLIPSVSTIAPQGSGRFFERLVGIKERLYGGGRFQLQFSIHSTDRVQRDERLPVKKWDFQEIAGYSRQFYRPGERKITLNFALAEDSCLSIEEMLKYFDPGIFLIKLTPVNPTIRAEAHHIRNAVRGDSPGTEPGVVKRLREAGYEVLVSIGELEENRIGSNCGQYVRRFLENGKHPGKQGESYTYFKTVTGGINEV